MQFKEFIINKCHKLEERYWTLKPRKRRLVGWALVILCLGMIYLSGYVCYNCGKRIGHFCHDVWVSFTEWDNQEDENVSDFEWSGNGPHRQFEVSEKNPKRNVKFGQDFNDINDVQLAAAKKMGIKPLSSRDEIENIKSKLVELHETKYYTIDKLTHSCPYLVKDAADFLTALGKLMQEYNGTNSRFIITSVLRTDSDVKRLSRGNVNASQNSCHRYATTFDITYNRFDTRDGTNEIQLKADLARALYDLRKAGYCYVKYERKEACFHITVRPKE